MSVSNFKVGDCFKAKTGEIMRLTALALKDDKFWADMLHPVLKTKTGYVLSGELSKLPSFLERTGSVPYKRCVAKSS